MQAYNARLTFGIKTCYKRRLCNCCKDVLQKTVIEEVALNYQLSTVVSQGMTDSRVIKQFKGGESHSLVKLSYSSSNSFSSNSSSSSSPASSSPPSSSPSFLHIDPNILFLLNPHVFLFTSISPWSFTRCSFLKLIYSTTSSSKPVRSISST